MRRQQKHAYDPSEIESLKGIPIPEKIKCGRCAKNLPHHKYSTKQLTDFRWQVKHQGRVTKPINCHGCAGGQQVVEIECVGCHKTKGLEDFAKSQRAKPDTAKCFKCIKEQVEQKPVDHDRYAAGNRPFILPDHVNGYVPDQYSAAASTHESDTINKAWTDYTDTQGRSQADTDELPSKFKKAMSAKDSDSEDLIGSEFASSNHSKTDKEGGWTKVGGSSWHTKSDGPATTSIAGSERTYPSSIAERSTGGWAKIKAYRPPSPPAGGPVMMPHGDAQREVDAAWGSDDESSDGEANDDDDDSDGENTTI